MRVVLELDGVADQVDATNHPQVINAQPQLQRVSNSISKGVAWCSEWASEPVWSRLVC